MRYIVTPDPNGGFCVFDTVELLKVASYATRPLAEVAARDETFNLTETELRSMSKKTAFAEEYAREVKALLDTLDNLAALKTEFLALDYATTMTDTDVASLGIVVADLYAAAAAVDAIKALLETGTNARALYTVSA